MYTTTSFTQNWNLPNNTVWNPNQGSGNLHPNCFEGYECIVANLLNFFQAEGCRCSWFCGVKVEDTLLAIWGYSKIQSV